MNYARLPEPGSDVSKYNRLARVCVSDGFYWDSGKLVYFKPQSDEDEAPEHYRSVMVEIHLAVKPGHVMPDDIEPVGAYYFVDTPKGDGEAYEACKSVYEAYEAPLDVINLYLSEPDDQYSTMEGRLVSHASFEVEYPEPIDWMEV